MWNRDFRDLLKLFNDHGVEYLLVGGYAVIYYAEPRFTKDLDLWVNPTPDNAGRVWDALRQFGAPLQDLTVDDLGTPDVVYQIGLAPNRVDLMTSVTGLSFPEAWAGRIGARYADLEIHVVGREQLIRNKKALGRAQDYLDLENLNAEDVIIKKSKLNNENGNG